MYLFIMKVNSDLLWLFIPKEVPCTLKVKIFAVP